MNLGTAQVIRANARHLPLADNSVDLVITSPPYFALRSYQDGGEHYAGQIGDEPTPAEFVDSLLEVTAECVRVLKPSGSLWVNLGDKYKSNPGRVEGQDSVTGRGPRTNRAGGDRIPAKSLHGIPWRYALRCIDDLGLILRAEVIWSKPNGLPESVTDRVRRSHEQWFHFTLQPRYFSAVDEIREPHDQQYAQRRFTPSPPRAKGNHDGEGGWTGVMRGEKEVTGHPLGKLPGSVWTVPTEPLKVPDHLGVDHFAAFPTSWPRKIIRGWSPSGVCVECGEGRRPVVTTASIPSRKPSVSAKINASRKDGNQIVGRPSVVADVTGYACACPEPTAPTTPAVVLDCFGGTGTTAMVAKALGRHGVSVDMSADYCRLAEWRTNDRNQLAKVLGVEKAEPVDEAQLDLFGGEVA